MSTTNNVGIGAAVTAGLGLAGAGMASIRSASPHREAAATARSEADAHRAKYYDAREAIAVHPEGHPTYEHANRNGIRYLEQSRHSQWIADISTSRANLHVKGGAGLIAAGVAVAALGSTLLSD